MENNSFGIIKVHELKPNGQQLLVNEDNKKEYVKLYVNYRFMRGIEHQFLALQKGLGFLSKKFPRVFLGFLLELFLKKYFLVQAFVN